MNRIEKLIETRRERDKRISQEILVLVMMGFRRDELIVATADHVSDMHMVVPRSFYRFSSDHRNQAEGEER
jgi:hypothetical protein